MFVFSTMEYFSKNQKAKQGKRRSRTASLLLPLSVSDLEDAQCTGTTPLSLSADYEQDPYGGQQVQVYSPQDVDAIEGLVFRRKQNSVAHLSVNVEPPAPYSPFSPVSPEPTPKAPVTPATPATPLKINEILSAISPNGHEPMYGYQSVVKQAKQAKHQSKVSMKAKAPAKKHRKGHICLEEGAMCCMHKEEASAESKTHLVCAVHLHAYVRALWLNGCMHQVSNKKYFFEFAQYK